MIQIMLLSLGCSRAADGTRKAKRHIFKVEKIYHLNREYTVKIYREAYTNDDLGPMRHLLFDIYAGNGVRVKTNMEIGPAYVDNIWKINNDIVINVIDGSGRYAYLSKLFISNNSVYIEGLPMPVPDTVNYGGRDRLTLHGKYFTRRFQSFNDDDTPQLPTGDRYELKYEYDGSMKLLEMRSSKR